MDATSPSGPADSLPRHLQAQQPSNGSASSSSNVSPAGTPPVSAVPSFAAANSSSRSPASSSAALVSAPSPSLPSAASQPAAPGSPSTPSTNRFSLNLGFIARRPRGWTTSSVNQQRSPGPQGSSTSLTTSPQGEYPPSPSAGHDRGGGGGYGFPALRRTLSKRNSSNATTTASSNHQQQHGQGAAGSHDTSRGTSRQRRSASQPPVPHGSAAIAAAVAGTLSRSESRPNTSSGGGGAGNAGGDEFPAPPSFPSLTATTSLPNPPDRSATESNAGASTSNATGGATASNETYKIRLVPHLESSRALHFEPIERDLAGLAMIRIGRFTDRHNSGGSAGANAARGTPQEPARVAFKSKVVSRGHAEIWVDEGGKFFIRDTKSSSGTFLNHIRLAGPNIESRPFPLKDGDVLQLGVDYQGGTEEIYRCVKMRVELNRGWQRGANSFNTAALAQLRALGGFPDPQPSPGTPAITPGALADGGLGLSGMGSATPDASAKATTPAGAPSQPAGGTAPSASITDCCICLYPVTVCQALFIAPCSHVTHFKCIRPLVEQNYPGFCCPLCRTYADLEADVEVDLPEPAAPAHDPPDAESGSAGGPAPVAEAVVIDEPVEVVLDSGEGADGLDALGGLARRSPPMDAVLETEEPASRAPSIRASGLARSRPPSIAPAAGSELNEEDLEMDDVPSLPRPDDSGAADRDEEESIPSGANDARPEGSEPASRDFGSNVPAMAIASPQSIPSHLSPPAMNDDIYASLASAATPPNSTFLSTLAESATGAARSAAAAVFGGTTSPGASSSGAAAIVPTSALARPPTSLDAAVLADAGPSTVSLSRSGSGSGTHTSDVELEGDAEPEAELEGASGGGASSSSSGPEADASGTSEKGARGKGKGKEKEKNKKRRSLSSSLFPPRDNMDHPDPAVAAALLI